MMKSILWSLIFLTLGVLSPNALADDGSQLWLKYLPVADSTLRVHYRAALPRIIVPGSSATSVAIRDELSRGLERLLGQPVTVVTRGSTARALVVGIPTQLRRLGVILPAERLRSLGAEGYWITRWHAKGIRVVAANTETGLLYGTFAFLRLLQTGKSIESPDIQSRPRIALRLLNHWDNLDGTVERGYAGKSLWRWEELPDVLSPRYHDYARACASIGINGAVLNNVNANPQILRPDYLRKIAALANVLRPFGIRVFLSVNFSSPLAARFEQEGNRRGGIGTLSTSDPLDPAVRQWWKEKVDEIYRAIPDFGGFLVKASSEGMPGPQEYGRTHVDGANMLADALAPHHGVVMWRAFVYDPEIDPDRVKRSYKEFVPLDGQFRPNVFVQAKNGPLDFQPREPVQPLFGALPHTPLMLELQVTQEYLGHAKHLVYLAPMWKEYLQFDTYANGPGSTLASIVDGTLQKQQRSGIAGVANIGDDANWCGHFFAQANWYAFGRLAWDHSLAADAIAREWIAMSLGSAPRVTTTVLGMMLGSWEACVKYMTPLGLHHIMQPDVHYGPGPGNDRGREDWRSTYYHRADSIGLGFDRGSTGSNAVAQYSPPLREQFDALATCPEKYLLWFHHVPWVHRLHSGRTLWDELCVQYETGVRTVGTMQASWESLDGAIDPEIYQHVRDKLAIQKTDATAWKDTCLGYFGTFSRLPVAK